MLPQTRYAKSGDVNIAYQVLGQGPPDLVLIPGWVSNIEIFWEEPAVVRFFTRSALVDQAVREWGAPIGIDMRAPSMATDERFRQWWARFLRLSASPAAFATLSHMNAQMDIRQVLPAIRVPTLILHSVNDRNLDVRGSRYLAERIPGAKLVELSGPDHVPWLSDADIVVDEVEEFLTGARHAPEPERVLATVMFTDIVGASERAAGLGDRRWHDLLHSQHALIRRQLNHFHGREINTAGD